MVYVRVIHLIVGLIGAYLVYLTYFMKESTEGVWTNRIEEFWISMDDQRKSSGEKAAILFRTLAAKISRSINRIFGPSLLSPKLAGVSGSLSFGCLLTVIALVLGVVCCLVIVHSNIVKPELARAIPLLLIVDVALFFAGAFCLMLAFLAIALKSEFWSWLSCAPSVLWTIGFVRVLHLHLGTDKQYGITGALAASLLCDILIIALIRQSLRWILSETSVRKMLVAIGLQALALFLMFVIPFRLPIIWRPGMSKTGAGQFFFTLAVFNLPTVVVSLAFGASVFLVVPHRLIWPALSELTYVLTRNEVLEKRRTVRWVGFACLVYAITADHSFWYYFAQKVMK